MRIPPLFKYELFNVLRGRWLIAYAVLFATLSGALLQLGSDPQKIVASLMSVILLVIPMVSILYASIYWYNSEGFTGLLLTQPIPRNKIYMARWFAISIALSSGFLIGTFPMLALHSALDTTSILLLALGVTLSFIFASLGLLISVVVTERMTGIGASFLAWFYLAIVHDGLVFLMMSSFHDYPLEIPSMIVTAINPVDLARVSLLLSLDLSAMMGYTGTILQKSLSGGTGAVLITGTLGLWIVVPLVLGVLRFHKRDF